MTPRTAPETLRPRVCGAREEEILDATVDELLAAGYDRLTMDAVAARARASKATLYRRWSSKPSLVVDAVVRSSKCGAMATPDTGSLRGDLIQLFSGPQGLASQLNARVLGVVLTAVQTDPEFGDRFRASFLAPKITVMQEIYRRAAARGELLPHADLALLGPALAGILLHRVFVLGDHITTDLVERVVDQIILPAATGRFPDAAASSANRHPAQETS
jgi:AcrR family transcriptional regulator